MTESILSLREISKRVAAEFHRRAEKNSRYSIRAYARDLGIDSSSCAKILKGQREATLVQALLFLKMIEDDEGKQLITFVNAVAAEHKQSQQEKD